MKRIKPYAARIEPWYLCRCGQAATWRINTTGVDGEGVDLCEDHASDVLEGKGNQGRLWIEARRRLAADFGEEGLAEW